jgi:hypothetical protein
MVIWLERSVVADFKAISSPSSGIEENTGSYFCNKIKTVEIKMTGYVFEFRAE